MRPKYNGCLPSKKRPMTPAERARRYRERRKLKALGISQNLLEQALIAASVPVLPEGLRKGGSELWNKEISERVGDDNTTCFNQENEYESSKNTGVVIKIEPGLNEIIHQSDKSQDETEEYIRGCNQSKKNDSRVLDSVIDIVNQPFYKQENENYLNSHKKSIGVETEQVLSDHVSQDDVSQDDTSRGVIPGSSRLKEGHLNTNNLHSNLERLSDDTNKTPKTGTERQEKYQNNMRDQQQQTNELPGLTAERWMINWKGEPPVAEPVLTAIKRPMTAAERKRKSREKQRAEEKVIHLNQENCSCGSKFRIKNKLKAEIDALTHKKELLSAQITLLQAQPQQIKLGLTENDSEDDLSNVSTNDSFTECSRSKEDLYDIHTRMKRAISVEKDHEINNCNNIKKKFLGMNGLCDDFQIFGDFVAAELRNLKSDVNRRKLKRMIQKVIIEVSESED